MNQGGSPLKTRPTLSKEPRPALQPQLEKIGRLFKVGSADESETAKEVERVRTALEWYMTGLMNPNKTFSFVQLSIALEALLGEPQGKKEIVDRLSDRCSFLVSRDSIERSRVKREIETPYNIRSRIVHQGRVELTDEESRSYDSLRHHLKEALLKEMDNIPKAKA